MTATVWIYVDVENIDGVTARRDGTPMWRTSRPNYGEVLLQMNNEFGDDIVLRPNLVLNAHRRTDGMEFFAEHMWDAGWHVCWATGANEAVDEYILAELRYLLATGAEPGDAVVVMSHDRAYAPLLATLADRDVRTHIYGYPEELSGDYRQRRQIEVLDLKGNPRIMISATEAVNSIYSGMARTMFHIELLLDEGGPLTMTEIVQQLPLNAWGMGQQPAGQSFSLPPARQRRKVLENTLRNRSRAGGGLDAIHKLTDGRYAFRPEARDVEAKIQEQRAKLDPLERWALEEALPALSASLLAPRQTEARIVLSALRAMGHDVLDPTQVRIGEPAVGGRRITLILSEPQVAIEALAALPASHPEPNRAGLLIATDGRDWHVFTQGYGQACERFHLNAVEGRKTCARLRAYLGPEALRSGAAQRVASTAARDAERHEQLERALKESWRNLTTSAGSPVLAALSAEIIERTQLRDLEPAEVLDRLRRHLGLRTRRKQGTTAVDLSDESAEYLAHTLLEIAFERHPEIGKRLEPKDLTGTARCRRDPGLQLPSALLRDTAAEGPDPQFSTRKFAQQWSIATGWPPEHEPDNRRAILRLARAARTAALPGEASRAMDRFLSSAMG